MAGDRLNRMNHRNTLLEIRSGGTGPPAGVALPGEHLENWAQLSPARSALALDASACPCPARVRGRRARLSDVLR